MRSVVRIVAHEARDAHTRRADESSAAPDTSSFPIAQETETKSSWWLTRDAAEAQRDAHIVPPAAGNGGAYGFSPTKCVQYATNDTTSYAL